MLNEVISPVQCRGRWEPLLTWRYGEGQTWREPPRDGDLCFPLLNPSFHTMHLDQKQPPDANHNTEESMQNSRTSPLKLGKEPSYRIPTNRSRKVQDRPVHYPDLECDVINHSDPVYAPDCHKCKRVTDHTTPTGVCTYQCLSSDRWYYLVAYGTHSSRCLALATQLQHRVMTKSVALWDSI